MVEDGHGDVEMLAGRVTPAAVVAGLEWVGRTEIGGRDEQRLLTWLTPLWVVDALYLETSPAALAVSEESVAQRRRVHPVPFPHHVRVVARAACQFKFANNMSHSRTCLTANSITASLVKILNQGRTSYRRLFRPSEPNFAQIYLVIF